MIIFKKTLQPLSQCSHQDRPMKESPKQNKLKCL